MTGTKPCFGGEGLCCRNSYIQRPDLAVCLSHSPYWRFALGHCHAD